MPTDPFVVHVARLRKVVGTSWHEDRSGPIELAEGADLVSPVDSTVAPGADVRCDVVLTSHSGGITARGTVEAPWVGVCRRCAVPVGGDLRVEVHERFCETGGHHGDPEDELAYPIVDERLDLAPMARDALVLELPLAPLCRVDCAGLCPTCGADRNEETCACVAPRDPRWANLDVLRSPP
jgi:uncharacterized protein